MPLFKKSKAKRAAAAAADSEVEAPAISKMQALVRGHQTRDSMAMQEAWAAYIQVWVREKIAARRERRCCRCFERCLGERKTWASYAQAPQP